MPDGIASPDSIANVQSTLTAGAQPALTEMWRSVIRKSMRPEQTAPRTPSLPTAIQINFDGFGLPLTRGGAGIVHVTFPCVVLSCHIFSGVNDATLGIQPIAASATVDLRLATVGSWGTGGRQMYAGSMPSISGSNEATVDITDWITELQPGDLLVYGLHLYAGTGTFLTLTLPLLRLDNTGLGVDPVVDGFGDSFTTGGGEPFTIRG